MADQVFALERVDDQGRLWRPIWVDETTLAVGAENIDEVDTNARQPGDVITWEPLAWNARDCDGDTLDDSWVWGADDRFVPSSLGDRQKTEVHVFNSWDCSGTIIRENFIVTAAHCIVDENGNYIPPNDTTVELPCRRVVRRIWPGAAVGHGHGPRRLVPGWILLGGSFVRAPGRGRRERPPLF